MIQWIKNNPIATTWMVSGVITGFVFSLGGGQMADYVSGAAGAAVGLLVSAYFSLYLYAGPSGKEALKRLIPALVVAALVGGLWYAGVTIPMFILQGTYGASMSLFIAAVVGRLFVKV